MQPALLAHPRPQSRPVDAVVASDVSERVLHALLQPGQAADVDVRGLPPEQVRDVRRPRAQPVLYVLLRPPGDACQLACKGGSPRFLVQRLSGSGCLQNPSPQQVMLGSPIHLPLDQLELGDLILGLPVAPARLSAFNAGGREYP